MSHQHKNLPTDHRHVTQAVTHLQCDDVGGVVPDLLHNVLFPVLPLERPVGAVAATRIHKTGQLVKNVIVGEGRTSYGGYIAE